MINEEKLINWCWCNLQFYNNPENWEDTFIIDILRGYQGTCHTVHDKVISYSKIRSMFYESEEEEEEEE